MAKKNPEYQQSIAVVYGNLADLQANKLNNYISAETNYNKDIEILEQLAKNNSECKQPLAFVYGILADLQANKLNNYTSAETNYYKQIEILAQLSHDNPYSQKSLAFVYDNLADLQATKELLFNFGLGVTVPFFNRLRESGQNKTYMRMYDHV